MSDTPRTDAVQVPCVDNDIASAELHLLVKHAQTLERELTAAQAEIQRLKEEREKILIQHQIDSSNARAEVRRARSSSFEFQNPY